MPGRGETRPPRRVSEDLAAAKPLRPDQIVQRWPDTTRRETAPAWHGVTCTPVCDQLAYRTTIEGPRAIRCPHCGADPGRGCRSVSRYPRPLVHGPYVPYHWSRVIAAAA